MLLEDAKWDSLHRIKQYEAVYETITKPHLSYLRITNVGSQTTVCRIHGHGAYFFPTSGDPVDNASSLGYTTSPTAQLTLPPAVYARAHSLRVGGCIGLPPRSNQWTKGALAAACGGLRVRETSAGAIDEVVHYTYG
ncbi:hypothetical protein EW146_g8828 [Bondarzewia mesenterica]|uniref:Uncharacterized protein n=1 Tax=Bondarzewia mesenterica TaxID=1095465 RepID=A0A4S4LBM9_9AGAM|nr:hypothetical protein EW146_g8828 [Bondarzewia mesenterica]